jgi:hypothetical protein
MNRLDGLQRLMTFLWMKSDRPELPNIGGMAQVMVGSSLSPVDVLGWVCLLDSTPIGVGEGSIVADSRLGWVRSSRRCQRVNPELRRRNLATCP